MDGPHILRPRKTQGWRRNLTLFSALGRLLAGQPSNQTMVLRLSINYSDQSVTFLQKHVNVPKSRVRFLEQNLQCFWFFGGSLVLPGAGIALLVSRQILELLCELKNGTE
jgi:hypothetical protein